MAILTENYQYIGRSGAVSCKAGWNYYILLYAKTAGSMDTGKHTVSLRMVLACTSDATFYGYGTAGTVTVDGIPAISWNGAALPGRDWSASGGLAEGGVYYYRHTELATGTAVVNTGWGAPKDIPISVSWGRVESVEPVPGWLPYYKTYASGTLTVTLPAILGASSITGADSAALGGNCAVRWTPVSPALSYRLTFSMGSWSYTTDRICPGVAAPYTYTGFSLPMDAAYQLPNAKTGAMAVTLFTYSENGTQLGSGSSATFAVTVPDSAAPTLSFQSLTPISSLPQPFDSLFVKGKSRLQAQVIGVGQYGATITDCAFTIEGRTYPNGGTTEYLSAGGGLTVQATARDSRGYESTVATSIQVLDYAAPTISVTLCARADSAGAPGDSGTCLALQLTGSCAPLEGRNSQRLWYRWKLSTAPDSAFSEQVTLTEGSSYAGCITDVEFHKQASYVVQLGVTDGLGESATAQFTVLTERIYWHRGEDFLALGMYTQNGGLECGWPARFYGQVYVGDSTLESYIENLVKGG